jgi:hypothetical protein
MSLDKQKQAATLKARQADSVRSSQINIFVLFNISESVAERISKWIRRVQQKHNKARYDFGVLYYVHLDSYP